MNSQQLLLALEMLAPSAVLLDCPISPRLLDASTDMVIQSSTKPETVDSFLHTMRQAVGSDLQHRDVYVMADSKRLELVYGVLATAGGLRIRTKPTMFGLL